MPCSLRTVRHALWLALAVLMSLPVGAEEGAFSGDVGLGVVRAQSVVRGASSGAGLMPYLAFDYGRAFARIDTFGVRTLKAGYGHVELLGRYRTDGFQVAGLARRGNSVPLGLGTLQVTPVGAFELTVLRDVGDSAGSISQARYIGKLAAGPLSFYPEAGLEVLDARYANHYYGTRQADALTLGQSYTAGRAANPFAGMMMTLRLGERWSLNAYARRMWLDETLARSPLVARGARNSGFVALSRGF